MRTVHGIELDAFTLAYIVAALWSSTDDDDVPMDEKYDIEDIAPETLRTMAEECKDFQSSNASLLEEAYSIPHYGSRGEYSGPDRAGHDFWLTRNHHGAGFWDRGLGDVGRKLTDAAHVYGSVDLCVGDDGKIYS